MADSDSFFDIASKEYSGKQRDEQNPGIDAMQSQNWKIQPEVFCGIITLINDTASLAAARAAVDSIRKYNSMLQPYIIPAVTPETLDVELKSFRKTIKDWTYPYKPGDSRIDIKSGMTLSAYNAKDYLKVVSCLVSHMKCWRMSLMLNTTLVILEHDAIFTKKFDLFNDIYGSGRDTSIIQLNNPLGATRKSQTFYDGLQLQLTETGNDNEVKEGYTRLLDAPWVDTDRVSPQGLAGNSAYVMNPGPAFKLFKLIDEHGLWPNDAIMCKQLLGEGILKVAYPHYTKLQGVASTTQG
tara:strand:+ start:10929 stop:11816 length:888 start_codon:yes stop_codon:yes gene_type:complete